GDQQHPLWRQRHGAAAGPARHRADRGLCRGDPERDRVRAAAAQLGVNLNTWVYWVLTRQGGTLTLYRDGVQIAQRADLPAAAAATINGSIASQANNLYYLNGKADDVAIYNRALSSTEARNGYVAALNGLSPNSPTG